MSKALETNVLLLSQLAIMPTKFRRISYILALAIDFIRDVEFKKVGMQILAIIFKIKLIFWKFWYSYDKIFNLRNKLTLSCVETVRDRNFEYFLENQRKKKLHKNLTSI